MNKLSQTLKPPYHILLQIGSLCVALCSDGDPYRVVVKKVDPAAELCSIYSPDYGFEVRSPVSNILKVITLAFQH